MTEVENPFGEGEVDASDPSGSAESIVEGTLGYALFGFMAFIGLILGTGAVVKLDSVLGTDMTEESSSGISIEGSI